MLEGKITSQQEELYTLNSNLKNYEIEKEEFENQISDLTKENNNMKGKLDELERENGKYKEVNE